MRIAYASVLLAVMLVAGGCDQRPPMATWDARAAAENLVLRERLDWGSAVEVLEPTAQHPAFQVRFAARDDGGQRIVLVDPRSGWARLPGRAYEPRKPALRPGEPAPPGAVQDGPWILVVIEPEAGLDAAAVGRLVREAARCNDTASRTGLWPLFFVHTDQSGRTGLVYGWQGDRGIARDEAIAAWAQSRLGRTGRWVDLLAPQR